MAENGEHILTEGDEGHRRESLRLLRLAVSEGWNLPGEWKQTLPEQVKEIADDPKAGRRERIAAMKLLAAMERDNTKKLELVDRMNRLDEGRPTENIHWEGRNLDDLTDDELAEEARKLAERSANDAEGE